MPARIKRLPVHRGYPVPWFVVWLDETGKVPLVRGDGTPDFRIIAPGAVAQAVYGSRCWVCGEKMGRHKAFVIGPMCAVNRTSAEPPSHRDCAEWSARACPFLSRPHMVRREAGLPDEASSEKLPGVALFRNPKAAGVWITPSYKPFDAGNGTLFRMGEPTEVLWFAEGRQARREEVQESIATGLPKLEELCHTDRDREALAAQVKQAERLLPA